MADNKNMRTYYRQLYVKVAPGEIYAFIPGTILDVFVKEGQKVKKGEPLCCLHAMKMDNQICSTIDGVVKSVNINIFVLWETCIFFAIKYKVFALSNK